MADFIDRKIDIPVEINTKVLEIKTKTPPLNLSKVQQVQDEAPSTNREMNTSPTSLQINPLVSSNSPVNTSELVVTPVKQLPIAQTFGSTPLKFSKAIPMANTFNTPRPEQAEQRYFKSAIVPQEQSKLTKQ